MVRIRTIVTKVQTMMRRTPFEEWKSQLITFPKPTIEGVVDEEPPPTTNPDAEPIGPQDHPLETKLVPNHPIKKTPKPFEPQPEPEMELKLVDLEGPPDLEKGKLLIAYLKGEPVIGISKQG